MAEASDADKLEERRKIDDELLELLVRHGGALGLLDRLSTGQHPELAAKFHALNQRGHELTSQVEHDAAHKRFAEFMQKGAAVVGHPRPPSP